MAKIFFLFANAVFFFTVFTSEGLLKASLPYFVALVILDMLLALVCIGFRAFSAMLALWMFGAVFYLLFAILFVPWLVPDAPITPYMELATEADQRLFHCLRLGMFLGILSASLTFASVVSPVEFLPWGLIGLRIALFFRLMQRSIEGFRDIKTALRIYDQWPEERRGVGRLAEAFHVLCRAPTLIRITFINMVLWLLPWGWLCYNKQKESMTRSGK
jgi:hypothetical protein